MLVSCKFHTKTREKGEVSQNLLARIVVATVNLHQYPFFPNKKIALYNIIIIL